MPVLSGNGNPNSVCKNNHFHICIGNKNVPVTSFWVLPAYTTKVPESKSLSLGIKFCLSERDKQYGTASRHHGYPPMVVCHLMYTAALLHAITDTHPWSSVIQFDAHYSTASRHHGYPPMVVI
ncbi:hypothetical protein BaRGS_00005048 [Batillaria attramentaria]|uniref:Uncharacterized protein n=1 Tax=Batillaria attramentaria TaxID=370345 RepID=A0ABD0LV47_9CAEN